MPSEIAQSRLTSLRQGVAFIAGVTIGCVDMWTGNSHREELSRMFHRPMTYLMAVAVFVTIIVLIWAFGDIRHDNRNYDHRRRMTIGLLAAVAAVLFVFAYSENWMTLIALASFFGVLVLLLVAVFDDWKEFARFFGFGN